VDVRMQHRLRTGTFRRFAADPKHGVVEVAGEARPVRICSASSLPRAANFRSVPPPTRARESSCARCRSIGTTSSRRRR
jgi:hypothetical protein